MNSSNTVKNVYFNVQKSIEKLRIKEKYAARGDLKKLIEKRTKIDTQINQIFTPASAATSVTPKKYDINVPQSYHELRSKMQHDNKFHKIAKMRAHHLSTYLLNYLINAFQSGLIGSQMNEYAHFQISKLVLQHDMNQLNIYWLTTNDEAKNKIIEDNFLQMLSSQIRYFLSSNRVISYVPPIKFHRDNSKALIEQLEEYIKNISQESKEAESSKKSSDVDDEVEKDEKIKTFSEEKKDGDELVDNLYGVDHAMLMSKLKNGSKIKAEKPLGTTTPQNYEKFEASIKELRVHQIMNKKNTVKKEVLIETAFAEFEYFKLKDQEKKMNSEIIEDEYE